MLALSHRNVSAPGVEFIGHTVSALKLLQPSGDQFLPKRVVCVRHGNFCCDAHVRRKITPSHFITRRQALTGLLIKKFNGDPLEYVGRLY